MFVRLGRPAGYGVRLNAGSGRSRAGGLAFRLFLLACAAMPACREASHQTQGAELSWEIVPRPARVGPALIVLTLTGPTKRPVTGASVSVEGVMTHPGMAPAVAVVEEGGRGRYDARLDFTMAGDWVLLVRAAWADGARLERRVPVRVAP